MTQPIFNSTPQLTINGVSDSFTDLSTLSTQDVQNWLADQIADQLGLDSEDIENNTPFNSYGLDSAQAMTIAVAGRQRFGLEISPLIIWNCPTIDSLSHYIVQELNAADTDTFEL